MTLSHRLKSGVSWDSGTDRKVYKGIIPYFNMEKTNKTMGKTKAESVGATETQERSLSEYVDAWQSHVKTLNRLRWNLPKQEDQDKLDKIQKELRSLIATAVTDLQRRRQVRENMRLAGVNENGE